MKKALRTLCSLVAFSATFCISAADFPVFIKEVEVGDGWAYVEDYFIPFGADMSMQCETGRSCEVATGVAAFGDVGKNNRGPFTGNKEFSIGPAGAVYARMADGRGKGHLRYYRNKIGTKTWALP